MHERTGIMTMDEFIRLYEKEGPFELVNGERIALSPTVAKHAVVVRAIYFALYTHCSAQNLGEVFSESPFVLTDDPNWVAGSRVPDVLFYQAERWTQYKKDMPDWEDKPFVLVPDLAVEIVSPTDRFADVQEKVESYLRDGVQVVWLLDPARASVTVYEDDRYHTVSGDATLSGGPLLPGFSVVLEGVFRK